MSRRERVRIHINETKARLEKANNKPYVAMQRSIARSLKYAHYVLCEAQVAVEKKNLLESELQAMLATEMVEAVKLYEVIGAYRAQHRLQRGVIYSSAERGTSGVELEAALIETGKMIDRVQLFVDCCDLEGARVLLRKWNDSAAPWAREILHVAGLGEQGTQ